jgi:Protein of unknown function (DUF2971)
MRLYKYVTLDVLHKILEGRIRFKPPGQFNDPFEIPGIMAAEVRARFAGLGGLILQTQDIMSGLMSSPFSVPAAAYTLPSDDFRRASNDSDQKGRQLSDEEVQKEILSRIQTIDSTYGILSLTQTNENLLMWAHYADDHRGAVIELDLDDEFLYQDDPNRKFARAVKYSTERATIPIDEGILMEHFFVKSPEWAYEPEIRVIRRLEHADDVIKPDGGPDIHLFTMPPEYVKRIFIGVRTESAALEEVLSVISTTPDLNHIECSRAHLDPAHFAFQYIGVGSRPARLSARRSLARAGRLM